ncbi:MAG: D-alanyl-D-alanine carboxypeptidase/D-alanyl-D-alanine-endopeptidase [Porphyromonadaceae bacterium CG2_30_38_12]|nr:MAG: D-alanyl-D-alanine carboxypeptidase/D-alanyl-D-alanine-endopeptidase [Porphyromonadaceae bacterium CG2_30_38_12]
MYSIHTITNTILLLSCFVGTQYLAAQQVLRAFMDNDILRNANISLLIEDLNTGKTIVDLHAKTSITPASTMKLVTTATALELQGADYQFTTTLEIDGKIGTDSVLSGNLYVRSGGDPTLGSEKMGNHFFLDKWAKLILTSGINKVNGNIIVIEDYFDSQVINPKWTWEDMGNYYAPGIHSLAYRDNTFRCVFKTGAINSKPKILGTDPFIYDLTIDNQLHITATKSDLAYFYGAPFSKQRSVYGEIPANKDAFTVKGDLPHPAEQLVADFNSTLVKNGIQVLNQIETISNVQTAKTTLTTELSPSLGDIVQQINNHSDNQYAEYVFKNLSAIHQQPGTIANALKIIKNYWESKGLPVEELNQQDGSGLSPTNAISANFFVQLLRYMRLNSQCSNVFYKSLAISGKTGTLKNFLSDTKLEGKVHAKSGTIAGVKSYAGFIETGTKTYVFAVLVNNAHGTSKEVTAKIEKLLLNISAFE